MSYTSYDLSQEPPYAPAAFYPSVIIVQARMGSTRFPGKVLDPFLGKPMLQILLERLRNVVSCDAICIATTTLSEDNQIADFCAGHSVFCYRGDSEDLLSRYYGAAKGFDAEVVVRITSDCPFIDPRLVDNALFCFRNHYDTLDYLTNTLERTYPRGMDIEIMRTETLEDAFFHAISKSDKEHVTPYIRKKGSFRLGNFFQKQDQSYIRITVDTQDDAKLLQQIYDRIPNKANFHLEEIVQIVQKEPELLQINAHITQKTI